MEISLVSEGAAVKEATKFLLIGKIHSDKPINRKGAMGVLRSIWGLKEGPVITELGMQIYGLAFKSEDLMLQAMIDSPWSVMGFCLILKRWEVEKSISEISFDKVQYWVQIHDLPLEMQTLANLKKIGDSIGRVIMLEKPDWSQGTGRCYMRTRLELDVNKSLIPGFWVPRQDKGKLWVRLKYEKLGDFCFNCGKIGHMGKNCDVVLSDNNRENAFGPWMKAAPVRTVLEERLITVDESGTFELPWDGPVNENARILIRKRLESCNGGVAELDEDELRDLGLLAKDATEAAREESLSKHSVEHVEGSEYSCKARDKLVGHGCGARESGRVDEEGDSLGVRNVGESASGKVVSADLGKRIEDCHVDFLVPSSGKGDVLGASSLGTLAESADLAQIGSSISGFPAERCAPDLTILEPSPCDPFIFKSNHVDLTFSKPKPSTQPKFSPTILAQTKSKKPTLTSKIYAPLVSNKPNCQVHKSSSLKNPLSDISNTIKTPKSPIHYAAPINPLSDFNPKSSSLKNPLSDINPPLKPVIHTSSGENTFGGHGGDAKLGYNVSNLAIEDDSVVYQQALISTSNDPVASVMNASGNPALHQVEIGLSSFFRNLNLKRRFEDVLMQNELSSKRIWIESDSGFSVKYITNESSMSLDMEDMQNSDDQRDDKANRVMVRRRLRNKTRINDDGRLKEVQLLRKIMMVWPGSSSDTLPQKVEEIMDKEVGAWKLEAIRNKVEPSVIRSIERIPICQNPEQDRAVWPYNKDGTYSVKSGYYAIKNQVPRNSSISSSSHQSLLK
ncbi:Zinc finger, CCHC-type [Corchorus olitorius]|uniref:Zinc finger, CCHC-type n=1 Tax=Corchorus olitorius TaxID=93759 RepID=A0A1R3I9K7_9ROSI|nr:Zinc finger, CCHC-type [Corchorus olitorius]